MKISPINTVKQNHNYITKKACKASEPSVKFNEIGDSVSFSGIRGAAKGFGTLGIAGAIVGAIVSGGTSIIPTMIYFGACNGLVGAFVGHGIEETE